MKSSSKYHYNLPVIPQSEIGEMCWNYLTRVIDRYNIGETELFDMKKDAFLNHIARLWLTPRNVKRFHNTLEIFLPMMKGKVNLDDLVLLLLIKTGAPDLYDFIRKNRALFLGKFDKTDIDSGTEREILQITKRYKSYSDLLAHLLPYSTQIFDINSSPDEEENMDDWFDRRSIRSPKFFTRYFTYDVRDGEITDIYLDTFLDQLQLTSSLEEQVHLYDSYVTGHNSIEFNYMLKPLLSRRSEKVKIRLYNTLVVEYERTYHNDKSLYFSVFALMKYLHTDIFVALDQTIIVKDNRDLQLVKSVYDHLVSFARKDKVRKHTIHRLKAIVRDQYQTIELDRILEYEETDARALLQEWLNFEDISETIRPRIQLWLKNTTIPSLNRFLEYLTPSSSLLSLDTGKMALAYAYVVRYIPFEYIQILQDDYKERPQKYLNYTYITAFLRIANDIYITIQSKLDDIIEHELRDGGFYTISIPSNLEKALKIILDFDDPNKRKEVELLVNHIETINSDLREQLEINEFVMGEID